MKLRICSSASAIYRPCRTSVRIDNLLQILRDEGEEDLTALLAIVEAYQDRLGTQGFGAEEVQAAQTIGIVADELEAIR